MCTTKTCFLILDHSGLDLHLGVGPLCLDSFLWQPLVSNYFQVYLCRQMLACTGLWGCSPVGSNSIYTSIKIERNPGGVNGLIEPALNPLIRYVNLGHYWVSESIPQAVKCVRTFLGGPQDVRCEDPSVENYLTNTVYRLYSP